MSNLPKMSRNTNTLTLEEGITILIPMKHLYKFLLLKVGQFFSFFFFFGADKSSSYFKRCSPDMTNKAEQNKRSYFMKS